MYVCVCNAVTDCQIREAYCNGACSMRQLRSELGVGGCCGRCAKCARGVLRECQQEGECLAAAPAELADAVTEEEPLLLTAAMG